MVSPLRLYIISPQRDYYKINNLRRKDGMIILSIKIIHWQWWLGENDLYQIEFIKYRGK